MFCINQQSLRSSRHLQKFTRQRLSSPSFPRIDRQSRKSDFFVSFPREREKHWGEKKMRRGRKIVVDCPTPETVETTSDKAASGGNRRWSRPRLSFRASRVTQFVTGRVGSPRTLASLSPWLMTRSDDLPAGDSFRARVRIVAWLRKTRATDNINGERFPSFERSCTLRLRAIASRGTRSACSSRLETRRVPYRHRIANDRSYFTVLLLSERNRIAR